MIQTDLGARIIAIGKNPSLHPNRQMAAFANVWPDTGCVAGVSVESEMSEVVDEVAKEFGEITALAYVAGIGPNCSIVSMRLDFWNIAISNSLTRVYLMTSRFLPIIKDQVGVFVSVFQPMPCHHGQTGAHIRQLRQGLLALRKPQPPQR